MLERKRKVKYNLTEDDFNDRLVDKVGEKAKQIADRLRADAENLGYMIEWKQGSYVIALKDPGGSGQRMSLLIVYAKTGNMLIGDIYPKLKTLSLPQEIAREFAINSAALFSNCVESDKYPAYWSRSVNILELEDHYDEFVNILESTVKKIRDAAYTD